MKKIVIVQASVGSCITELSEKDCTEFNIAYDESASSGVIIYNYSVNGGESTYRSCYLLKNGLPLKKAQGELLTSKKPISYSNGFGIVEVDGGYAYILERNGKLLPYRYDVATPFNESGFAMVAKAGRVGWINENFEFFDGKKFVTEDLGEEYETFVGYDVATNFDSNGISLLSNKNTKDNSWNIQVLSISGKLKGFKRLNYKENKIETLTTIKNSEEIITFDKDRMYFGEDGTIYLADGYAIKPEDLKYVTRDVGLHKLIFEILKKDIFVKINNDRKQSK